MRGAAKAVARIYREVAPVVAIAALVEIAPGLILLNGRAVFAAIPGVLALIPGLMQLRGCVGSSLAQRLSSAIHMGLVEWRDLKASLRSGLVIENVGAAAFLGVLSSAALAIAVWLYCSAASMRCAHLAVLMALSVSVAALASAQAFLTVLVATYVTRRGLDPDNVTIPVVATVSDLLVSTLIVAMACLIYAAAG